MEACGRGLDDIINDRQLEDKLFSHSQIMAVTRSVSHALSYLHNTVHLLHGDLKGGNVLVKGDFREIKLCDFGVSIFLKVIKNTFQATPSGNYIGILIILTLCV